MRLRREVHWLLPGKTAFDLKGKWAYRMKDFEALARAELPVESWL